MKYQIIGDFDTIIHSNNHTGSFQYKYFDSTFCDKVGIFKFKKDMLERFTENYSQLPDDIYLGFYITNVSDADLDYLEMDSHPVVKDKSDFFVLNRIPNEIKEEIIDSFDRYYQSGVYLELSKKIFELERELYKP